MGGSEELPSLTITIFRFLSDSDLLFYLELLRRLAEPGSTALLVDACSEFLLLADDFGLEPSLRGIMSNYFLLRAGLFRCGRSLELGGTLLGSSFRMAAPRRSSSTSAMLQDSTSC